MLIILEGPDGVGKSTLAQRLHSALRLRCPEDRVEIIKKGPPKGHPLDEYVRPLLAYRPDRGRHIICDRWHWGERIYPQVLGRKTQMDEEVWRYVEMFLESRGALVVAVGREVEDHRKSFIERGDDLIDVNQLTELGRLYTLTQTRSLLPSVAYRAVSHDDNEHHNDIIVQAWRRERRNPLAEFTTYVGPRQPKILLFGDVRNGEFAEGDGAAFGPYPATSGHYLLRALATTQWRPQNLGLANACDVDDPVTLWKALDCPQVVTLGANAHFRAKLCGIPHGAVPHPQYVRRFHHKDYEWYGELIKEARTGGDLRSCRP